MWDELNAMKPLVHAADGMAEFTVPSLDQPAGPALQDKAAT